MGFDVPERRDQFTLLRPSFPQLQAFKNNTLVSARQSRQNTTTCDADNEMIIILHNTAGQGYYSYQVYVA